MSEIEDSAEDLAWQNVVRDIHEKYIVLFLPTMSADQLFPGADANRAVQTLLELVQSKPVFGPLEPLVDLDQVNRISEEINPLPVESLVRHAAPLLDRILMDRAAYFQLRVEAFKLAVELIEFVVIDSIQRFEEQAGSCEQDLLDVEASKAADSVSLNALQAHLSAVKDQLDAHNFNVERLRSIQKLAARNQALPIYKRKADDVYQMRSFQISDTEKLEEKTQYQAADWLAGKQAAYRLRVEGEDIRWSYDRTQSDVTALQARTDRLSEKIKCLRTEAAGSHARLRVRRNINSLKMAAFVEPGGALNYAERLKSIEQRYRQDAAEAFACIVAIRRGMEIIYSLDIPPVPQLNMPGSLDRAIAWIREVANALDRLQLRDQPEIIRITNLDAGHGGGTESGSIDGWRCSFTLTPADFRGRHWIRLRGIEAFTRDTEAGRICRLQVTPPAQAQFLGRDGAVTEHQQEAYPAWLGRVGARSLPRGADSSVIPAWNNASPIGTWTVSLKDERGSGVLPSDIELDISLVTQTGANQDA